MESLCKKTKDSWQKISPATLSAGERKEIIRHLQTCPRCRKFARYRGFTNLLRECTNDTTEPSEEYFINLDKKLTDLPHIPAETGFTEVVAQKSWRLAPVMALVLFILIATVSYQYETMVSMNQPLEELLLFEDQQLSGQQLLNAIITEGQANGE